MEKARFKIKRNVLLVLTLSFFGLAACSSRPCREPRAPELDQTKRPDTASSVATSGAAATTSSVAGATNDPGASSLDVKRERARVQKPDGSRQCEKGGAKSVEAMERELAGIKVYAREKRRDGLMHIQVCGSPSGMINLYEIDTKNVKQAEERGFKRFED